MEDIFRPKKVDGSNYNSKNIQNIYKKKLNFVNFLKIMYKIVILYR